MDPVHKYVVTTERFDMQAYPQTTRSQHKIEIYSAQDAVDAVRTWLSRHSEQRIGGSAVNYERVVGVEAYVESEHGPWLVERGGPGRSMGAR